MKNFAIAVSSALVFIAAGCGDEVTDTEPDPTDMNPPADTTPPTVTITDSSPDVADGDVTFTFTFSEDVGTSFTIDDVAVTGGTAGAFASASGTVSTLIVMPPAASTGTLSVEVAAMSFEDAAGNSNVDAVTAEQPFDTNTAGGAFDGVVFDDDYGTDVSFVEFGGSVNDLTVDTSQAQSGSSSLRVAVPASDYTGGALAVTDGVDASSFDALTFWVRADAERVLNVAGVANDAVDATQNTELVGGLPVGPTWTQYTIPIPGPAAFTSLTGLFHFAEGSDEGAYTLWFDEVRYVNLPAGSVTNLRPSFASATEALGVGETARVSGAAITLALNGADLTLSPAAPAFYDYASSDAEVATVDGAGVITGVGDGTAVITGTLGGAEVSGMVTVNVGAGCEPSGPNLAVNGDFETGDFSCIQQFPAGGAQAISTDNPSDGTYAANLSVVTQDMDTLIKFANLTPGDFTQGETIFVSFDLRGTLTPGGVVFAEFFSELTGGGTSAAEILFGGGPIFPNADPNTWTNFSTTALAGPDTTGGVTLQLKALSGGGTADVFFDNVCVSKMPCP